MLAGNCIVFPAFQIMFLTDFPHLQELVAGSKSVNMSVFFSRLIKFTGIVDVAQGALLTRDVVLEAPEYLQKIDSELATAVANLKLRTIYNYM
jgi:hypothetical protein